MESRASSNTLRASSNTLELSELARRNYTSTAEVVCNSGGSSSGKTYCVLQVLMLIMCTEPNRVISVVAAHYPNIVRGVYRDASSIWSSTPFFKAMIPDGITRNGCRCPATGSAMEFVAFASAEMARGGKRDYLMLDEANTIPYEIFIELQMRTKVRTWLTWNPTSTFYANTLYENNPKAEWIFSTHKANRFLPQKVHDELEGLKNTNPEKYRVYCLGKRGKVEGLVYTDWSLTDELPESFRWQCVGLDFGFTNDPTAIVLVRYVNGQLWVKEVCYQRNLTNPDIAEILKSNGLDGLEVVCDSAEQKSIEELRRNGILYARGAVKGPGSINSGVDLVRSLHINVTRDSSDMQDELMHYSWKKDSLGHFTNTPEDRYNHLSDALRYCVMYKMPRSGSGKSIL